MPLEFLHEIATKELPLTVTDLAEIDKLRVLRASGHVAALLPAPGASEANQFARVLAVTAKGHEALAAGKSPPP